MVDLPKKINPDPIVESIVEFRFSKAPALPEDAIFGILYDKFKDEYPVFDPLPILQLPAAIREQDQNLLYQPRYKTQVGNFILQIGPRVCSISNVNAYEGWDIFSKKINDIYEIVEESGVIDVLERVGLRYINILSNINVFEKSNFSISLQGENLNRKTNITTEIDYPKGNCILKSACDAEIQIGGPAPEGKTVTGSVIDIDSVPNLSEFENVSDAIGYAHEIEKDLFYRILTDDYLKTLNPEY